MSEELFDLEIKKSFEEEFDAQDIFVSEDLIARTMAAIKSQESNDTDSQREDDIDSSKDNVISVTKNTIDSTNTATETEKVVDITAHTTKKRYLKWISGIAAALVIGVVGLFIFKNGIGGIKETSDYAAANYATASDNSYSGNKYKDEPKAVTESVKEEASASAASERNPAADEYDMEVTCAPASDSLTGVNNFANESLKSEEAATADEKDDREMAADGTLGIQDGNPENIESITKEMMFCIDGIVAELEFTGNNEMLYTKENMNRIYATTSYKELLDYGELIGETNFKSVLKEMYEAKEGTANEINIMYLLIQDASKENAD